MQVKKVTEEQALKNYLTDPVFSRYYGENRWRVGEIQWVLDPTLEAVWGAAGQAEVHLPTTGGEAELKIRVRTLKAEGLFIAAHELTHHFMTAAGYPHVGFMAGVSKEKQLDAVQLDSLILDIGVNTLLAQAGFDVLGQYRPQMLNTAKQITRLNRTPDMPLGAFVYADHAFQGEIARIPLAENEVIQVYLAHYPRIALEGQNLYNLVRQFGYDHPEKVMQTFAAIISRYNMRDLILARQQAHYLAGGG